MRNDAVILVIGSRAEAIACAGQDHHSRFIVEADFTQCVTQRNHDIERHGVHPLGAVHGDKRDSGLWFADLDEGQGSLLFVEGSGPGTWRENFFSPVQGSRLIEAQVEGPFSEFTWRFPWFLE